ncbi:hypothetical protein [Ulvibacter sp. MAR_2010_11]|uniref:hypothetical protein n=1 Tax=Ulvibacter sp. MAR_2010_11 TaxID=1250229 RepID=UPI000C2C25A9|nr:hypothetical protein [Ulvibacter sp. MAR_2010_11]
MKNIKSFLLYAITVFAIVASIIWGYYERQWEASLPEGGEAVLRVDLFVIYPVLITLIALSLYRLFGKKRE